MKRLQTMLTVAIMAVAGPMILAQDAQKFEFKFEEKKAFYQEMTTSVVQTIKVQGGSDLTQRHQQTFYFAWTPEKFDKDKGTWTLKQKIEGIKMEIDIAGNPIKYDSTKKDTTAVTNPGLTDFYNGLIGSEFTVTMKNGVVEKVDGKDELLKKLASANAQMEALLKKVMSDEAVKQMSDPTFGLMPAKEVKKDETWEKKQSLNLGPVGSYDVTYKFKYLGKDAAVKDAERIEVTTDLKYSAPKDTGDGLLFRIKSGTLDSVDPKAGYVLFDSKLGRITTSQMGAKLKGTLNVTVGGTDTTVELYQEQTTTVNTKDVSFVTPATTTPTTPATTPEKK